MMLRNAKEDELLSWKMKTKQFRAFDFFFCSLYAHLQCCIYISPLVSAVVSSIFENGTVNASGNGTYFPTAANSSQRAISPWMPPRCIAIINWTKQTWIDTLPHTHTHTLMKTEMLCAWWRWANSFQLVSLCVKLILMSNDLANAASFILQSRWRSKT